METIFERNTFQRAATPCLRDAAKVLDSLGLEWWCEAGTCLGIVRDKDFVPHDKDIDIGLTDWARHEELENALVKDGFRHLHTFGTPENGLEKSFAKHGVKVDFFYFYGNGERFWHSAWKGGEEQIFLDFPEDCILPVRRVPFMGYEVNLPKDPEAYLSARYGDWKTVKEDWDWANDPLCLRK